MDTATVSNSGSFGYKVRALVHCTSLGGRGGPWDLTHSMSASPGTSSGQSYSPAWASGPALPSSSSLQGAPFQAQSARMALSVFPQQEPGSSEGWVRRQGCRSDLRGLRRVFTPLLWRGPPFFKAPPGALRNLRLGGRDISGCGDSSSCSFEKVCELGLIFPASQVLLERCPEDSGMLKTPSRTLCLVWPRKVPDMTARAELSSLRGSLSRLFSISKQNGKVLRKMLLRDLGLKPCTNLRE